MSRARDAFRAALFIVAFLFTSTAVGPAAAADDGSRATVTAQLMALRGAYAKRAEKAGLTCPIGPPKLIEANVPSFGDYESKDNSIRTPLWQQLSSREKAAFARLVSSDSATPQVRAVFESAVHHWIFVHELGHWWQACRHMSSDAKPYAVEYGANRLAVAYWRETDPHFMVLMSGIFHQVYSSRASPVPPGSKLEAYFNANYETLGPSSKYPWFQSQMILRALSERPRPSFLDMLEQT